MIEKKRINCPIRHIAAYIVKYDDGSSTVKCANIKVCGDSCPYLKDPDYKREYERAPLYQSK
ncbi:MAG: hypothetical protein KAV87_62245 [Desulfobacteraceae bacterium]|nr:hypothetical protein [Desulfobacteraceae bacterium]